MHVLTPNVYQLLGDLVERDVRESGQIQLTTTLNGLAGRELIWPSRRGERGTISASSTASSMRSALSLGGCRSREVLASLLESIVRIGEAEA